MLCRYVYKKRQIQKGTMVHIIEKSCFAFQNNSMLVLLCLLCWLFVFYIYHCFDNNKKNVNETNLRKRLNGVEIKIFKSLYDLHR